MPRNAAPEPETIPLKFGNQTVQCPVLWRRSAQARRIGLRLDPRAGAMVLTLPPRARREAGLGLLKAHADWVVNRLRALPPALPLRIGVAVPFAGLPHVITRAVTPRQAGGAASPSAWVEPGKICVRGPEDRVPQQVAMLLHEAAQQHIAALVARYAAQLGVAPRAVRLKDTRTRWGSCSVNGTLAFSWRLIMAPDWVLAHAVAHEVAHLRVMNHGPDFWELLKTLNQDRIRSMSWLAKNGPGLLRVG